MMNNIDLLPGDPDPTILDRVPWIELDHAYGSAVEIPAQLKQLLNPDSESRRSAYYGFYSNLFHQGTVYSATVAAIPVFQELLRYPQFAERMRILELLVSFAIGFPEDQHKNVDVSAVLRHSSSQDGDGDEDNETASVDDHQRECYLEVAAGCPLYELLLEASEPQVKISAAFALAFFPAHASESCRKLLAIAADPLQHEYVRSSALMACSYLDGGAVYDSYRQYLASLVEKVASQAGPLSLILAAAAYCILRENVSPAVGSLRVVAENLAVRCLEQGIQLPECHFYRTAPSTDSTRLTQVDVQQLMMPDVQFPWGKLQHRIRRHVAWRPPRIAAQPAQRRGPDPDTIPVVTGDFDRANVIAAVRRIHAHKWGFRTQNSGPDEEFRPYIPYLMQAWDEFLRLLDSGEIEDRWAAVRVLDLCGPLEESAVDQLLERLHRGDNGNLVSLIAKQPVSERQCQPLCDQLLQGELTRSIDPSLRQDYRRIVIQHGSLSQIRRLFELGGFEERAAAAEELASRGEIASGDFLPIMAESLLSSDFGLSIRAKMTFSQSETAHQWFFNQYPQLRSDHKWAIADALSRFRADLSAYRDVLFAQIQAEQNPVLAAKLVDVVANTCSPDSSTINRLCAFCRSDLLVAVRVSIVKTLSLWSRHKDDDPQKRDDLLRERLESFVADRSPRVRHIAAQAIGSFRNSPEDTIRILRSMLQDADSEVRRQVVWLLSDANALTAEDFDGLLATGPSDRLVAEFVLAASLQIPRMEGPLWNERDDDEVLTRSVKSWLSRSRPKLLPKS